MKKLVALIIILCISLLSACNDMIVTSDNTETPVTTDTGISSVADSSSQQTSINEETSATASTDTDASSMADTEKEITQFIYHPSMTFKECYEGVKMALEQLPDKWTYEDLYEILGVPDFGYNYASPYSDYYFYTDMILCVWAGSSTPNMQFKDENGNMGFYVLGDGKEALPSNSWSPCGGILEMDLKAYAEENVPSPPETIVPFTYDSSMSDEETAAALEKALNQLPYGWTPEQLYEILGEPHYTHKLNYKYKFCIEYYVFGNCIVKYGLYHETQFVPIKISYYDESARYNMTAFSILRKTNIEDYFTTS